VKRSICCVATLLAGCGGSDPTAPSQTSQPAGANCRTFATRQTSTLTSTSTFPGVPVIEATGSTSCAFDAPSATLRCDSTTAIASCNSTSSFSSTYSSVADFVDEGAVIGRALVSRSTSSGTVSTPDLRGGCVSAPFPATSVNYTYDAQRRPTSASDSTGAVTITYTAWDASGRPTRGTTTTSVCSSEPFSYGYDDAARTIVYTTERGGIGTCPLSTSIYVYDGMGLLVRTSGTTTLPSPFGDSTITSVGVYLASATAQVCK
jgi:hypothetical protein